MRLARISTGVTTNHTTIEIRENSAVCLVAKAQRQQDDGRGCPTQQRADGLAMGRDAAPTPIHAADLGQQAVDDDRHGGGDDVVLDAWSVRPHGRRSASPATMHRASDKPIPGARIDHC